MITTHSNTRAIITLASVLTCLMVTGVVSAAIGQRGSTFHSTDWQPKELWHVESALRLIPAFTSRSEQCGQLTGQLYTLIKKDTSAASDLPPLTRGVGF